MSDLITKLEGLTEPCRECDEEVARLDGWITEEIREVGRFPFTVWVRNNFQTIAPPAYTASVDAVLELIERELPGAYTFLHNELEEGEEAPLWTGYSFGHEGRHPLPAVALLIAFLRAKEN